MILNTTQDPYVNKSKAFSLGAIMRNKNLAKEMTAAWDSPVGSTKRTKAKSILLSLQKTRRNHDGMGGPGYSLPQNTQYMTLGPSGEVVPGDDRSFMNYITQQNIQSRAQQAPQTGLVTEKTAQAMPQTRLLSGGFDLSKLFKRPAGAETQKPLSISPIGEVLPIEQDTFLRSISAPKPAAPAATLAGQAISAIAQPPLGYSTMYSPDGTIKTDEELKAEGFVTPEIVEEMSSADPQKMLEQVTNWYDKGQINSIDYWFENLSPGLQNQYAEIYEAVKSGMTKTAFFNQLMSDRKAASELSGIPEEFIPAGISLTRSLKEERERLEKELNIDQQLSNLNQMLNAGVNIDNDLSSYIKGKDEYLGAIDAMIDKARDYSFSNKIDMSNPYVANRMQNYMNYLGTIRGRQNQRYVDFLKNATDDYNAKIERMQNTVDLSISRVEDKMTDIKLMAEEDYANIKDTIYGLYDSIEGMTKLSRDELTFEGQMRNSYLDTIKSIIEINQLNSDIMPKTYEEFIEMANEETGRNFFPEDPYAKQMYQDYLSQLKEGTEAEQEVITAKDYFSDTQIAKGALNAGMSITDFGNLSKDEANQYISEIVGIVDPFAEK